MQKQIKNQFDAETLKKIARSFFYCLLSGIGAGLVAYSQIQNLNTAILTGLGAFGTILVTATKEFKSGE